MNRFTVKNTPISALFEIDRQPLKDDRGSFSRLFCATELAACGWVSPIAQINHSVTIHRGSLRGMHFQYPPHAEQKLVSCLRGEVWDVAVDIRLGSPTFLQWHGALLSSENCRMLLIPEGFAHGFQTLSNEVELLYCHSAAYSADCEGALHPLDPCLSIDWPLPITKLSERDRSYSYIDSNFQGISL